MRKDLFVGRVFFIVLVCLFAVIFAMAGVQYVFGQSEVMPKTAKDAIEISQSTNKYLFLVFYDKKSPLYDQMEETINNFAKQSGEKILMYENTLLSGNDKEVIEKYKIDRAPLPLLLVIGPNGAVLGGFSKTVTQDKLAKTFVPPLTMDVLKSIQDQKMAIVVLQNGNTKLNTESLKTASELASDKKFAGATTIIKADPSDPKNKDFLKNAKLADSIAEATIVLIAPPGIVAGVYGGKVTKDYIVKSLSSQSSGCGPGGCGPGGCS